MIDFSFPESDGDKRPAPLPEPAPDMPPWRADLMVLLAAALAALGTFLYEAWTRTHPESML